MSTYEEVFADLNQAQQTAVTTIDGPVLVIAGPGTGKTQLLTTRVAHILATTDTLPQNILCLTFTESGALAMRERLTSIIGKAAYDVTISTYHAFGSELIRRFPDYFAEDPTLQPIDDLGIDHLYREIIANVPFNSPLRYADSYLGDIKSLVSDAKRALLAPDDLREVAQHNLAYIKQANPVIRDASTGIGRVSKKAIPAFEALADALQTLSAVPASTGITPLGELLLQELLAALEEVRVLDTQTPLSTWKKRWLVKDSDNQFVVEGQKTNEKLLAAAEVYEQYLNQLKAKGLFDYDDMILRAVRALETHPDLKFTLQEQYLYVLLDEFQDTNGAQLRLVELLTDNPVHEGRPNVLAVGDDDQAIYAFQGANYSHMLQFSTMYRDVNIVPLTQNYRSHADILRLAENISGQIGERLQRHLPGIRKTLVAADTSLPAAATIERRTAESDIMQFAFVAQQIRQLLDEGVPAEEIAVLAPQHKYLEPLVSFLNQAAIPVRYEKRENVLDDPRITQLQRMAELCLSLQANDRQTSNALWAEILSFAFWELPTSLIWQLSWQATDDDRSWTDVLLDNAELRPIALFFIRLSQLAEYETLETMLDYLLGTMALPLAEADEAAFTSPFYSYYFKDLETVSESGQTSIFAGEQEANAGISADFWKLLTNLIVLRARLREYKRDSETPLVLSDLIAFIAAHRAAEIKILNTSPYASGRNAVQLMTAYKAKGLEFNTVFLLAVSDEVWGSQSRGAGNRISLPANLQLIRYAGATEDERLRLFYVALTRAKSQLYLLSYKQTNTGKGLTPLKYLDEHQEDGQWISPLLPKKQQVILPAEAESVLPTTELAAYWQSRHEQAITSNDLQHLLQERLARFQLSPTHINDFTDTVYCGPLQFFLKTILRFPYASTPEVQFGNAMHETLEWIHITAKQDGLLPSRQTLEKVFEQRLRSKKLAPRHMQQYLERGQLALQAYLRQRSSTIQPDNVVEYSFRNEGVFIGNAHLTGKIDKLIINSREKTITIVDYKTGLKGHTHWTSEAKLRKYRHQLYLYRALVEGSHTFAGYQVTDAYLEFVEPDEQGNIQELHLNFNEDEYQRVKRLASAVWDRIMAFDLPDIRAYPANTSGMEAFEAYLLGE